MKCTIIVVATLGLAGCRPQEDGGRPVPSERLSWNQRSMENALKNRSPKRRPSRLLPSGVPPPKMGPPQQFARMVQHGSLSLPYRDFSLSNRYEIRIGNLKQQTRNLQDANRILDLEILGKHELADVLAFSLLRDQPTGLMPESFYDIGAQNVSQDRQEKRTRAIALALATSSRPESSSASNPEYDGLYYRLSNGPRLKASMDPVVWLCLTKGASRFHTHFETAANINKILALDGVARKLRQYLYARLLTVTFLSTGGDVKALKKVRSRAAKEGFTEEQIKVTMSRRTLAGYEALMK